MNNQELERAAHDLISCKINSGEVVHMAWAIQELISGMGEIQGDGVPFYALCAREHVNRVVKKVVDKYDQESNQDDSRQMRLQGFDYLQIAYTVERERERLLVPVGLITCRELLDRADEYERQASGLRLHAQEIRDYVAQRRVDNLKTA